MEMFLRSEIDSLTLVKRHLSTWRLPRNGFKKSFSEDFDSTVSTLRFEVWVSFLRETTEGTGRLKSSTASKSPPAEEIFGLSYPID
jgi:hypothetical protein